MEQIRPRLPDDRPDRPALLFNLGFAKDYALVWNFQKSLRDKRIDSKIPDTLVMVEHDHVLTMGRTAHAENVLVDDLPRFEIERGGDVTYHGPGQLVGYPIISLSERNLGIRQYVEQLEGIISDSLFAFGLECVGKLGLETGVWVDGQRKIASIGVAASHWVTYHGFALNVNTDLRYFQKIRPCGFDSAVMTSVSKELGKTVDIGDVEREIVANFADRFRVSFEDAKQSRQNF